MLYKVCITGGIACGKSSLGEMARKAGAGIIDADEVCHELLRKDKPLINRVISVFGAGILNRSGAIDRHRLGRIIFADAPADKCLAEKTGRARELRSGDYSACL